MADIQKTSIAYIVDERLPRERAHIAMRVINLLRVKHEVVTFRGDVDEETLLKALQERPFSLVLAPWYRYLAWSKIEGFYGIARTSGPTFAGYFADNVMPYEISDSTDYLRTLFFDFSALEPQESLILIQALITEETRTGVLPLLGGKPKIYTRAWYQGDTLGSKIDDLVAVPEILQTDWADRITSLKICLLALWAVVFEARGKAERGLLTTRELRAYFQIGLNERMLTFRLCYGVRGHFTPKDMLTLFWPNPKTPHAASQLLLSHTDFLRVHTIADTQDIEIVAGFTASAPSLKFPSNLRTLLIAPVSQSLVQEIPTVPEDGASGQASATATGMNAKNQELTPDEIKTKQLMNAALKIKEQKRAIEERDELIRELRSGGIGTAPPLKTPEPETLLESFQERFLASRIEVEKLESLVADAETRNAPPQELDEIRRRIIELTQREGVWIQKVISTIELVKQNRKKSDQAG